MIRCYYVANAATGEYFVLEKDFETYASRCGAYVFNLNHSKKCPNTYTIGSIEMEESQYEKEKQAAGLRQTQRLTGQIDDQGNPSAPEEKPKQKEGKVISLADRRKS